MLQTWSDSALETLELWVAGGDLLEMGAAAAAVADPPLLQDTEIALRGLALQQSILDHVMHTPLEARRSEPFKILREGLGFTLSVVVCAVPEAGFSLLRSMVEVDDRDVLWILRQNLNKKRLSRLAPAEVEALSRRLVRVPRNRCHEAALGSVQVVACRFNMTTAWKRATPDASSAAARDQNLGASLPREALDRH